MSNRDIFPVPEQLLDNEPLVGSNQRNVMTMGELDLSRARERLQSCRRFYTDTLSVDAIAQYFNLLPDNINELKERLEDTEQVLFGQHPLDDLVAQVTYTLELPNPQSINTIPLHRLNRVMQSQQFDRERYGKVIELVKTGQYQDATQEVQGLRSSAQRYFDDASNIFSRLRGSTHMPKREAFKTELFFTAKLYRSLFDTNSPWLGKPVISYLGGIVGNGQGDFHRPVRRNRLTVFEVSCHEVENTILSDMVVQNSGEQQERHLYCSRGSTVVLEHIEPFPLGACLPGMGYQIQYTAAVQRAPAEEFYERYVRPHLERRNRGQTESRDVEAEVDTEVDAEAQGTREDGEAEEAADAPSGPPSAVTSVQSAAKNLAAPPEPTRPARATSRHERAANRPHPDTAFPDVPQKNIVDHFILQDGDFRGFSINLFAGQNNVTCQPLLVGLQGIMPFWGYKQKNRFLLVRDRRASINDVEQPKLEGSTLKPARTKWQLRRLPLVFSCGQLIPRYETFGRLTGRIDKTSGRQQAQPKSMEQQNALRAMEQLGRKYYYDTLEERRKAAKDPAIRSGPTGSQGNASVVIQNSAQDVGQQLCHQLAIEGQIATTSYLVQFLTHANAFEHLRRALAYYSDGVRINGQEVKDSGALLPDGIELQTKKYDEIREEAFDEIRGLQQHGSNNVQSNISQTSQSQQIPVVSNLSTQLTQFKNFINGQYFRDQMQAYPFQNNQNWKEYHMTMMGIAQLERFFGWFAMCLRYLPSERLFRVQDIAQFEPGRQDQQNESARKMREMGITNQKAVTMYCGGDQINMYKLMPGEHSGKGFQKTHYSEISKILSEDASQQIGTAQQWLRGAVPCNLSSESVVENWRLYENTAFAQGELQYFNSLRFISNTQDNLGRYLGISILSLNSQQTSQKNIENGEKSIQKLLKYDVKRKCDPYRMQNMTQIDYPHMNTMSLDAELSRKYLRVLGFSIKKNGHDGYIWMLNQTSNGLVNPLMDSSWGGSCTTQNVQDQYAGQLIAYQQFRGEHGILHDKVPKPDDDETQHNNYDKTLEAILYFYFPYSMKRQTLLLWPNEFWPKYVFGLQAQCAFLQSHPGAKHLTLIHNSYDGAETCFLMPTIQAHAGSLRRVTLNTAQLASRLRVMLKGEVPKSNREIYTTDELKGLFFLDYWLNCTLNIQQPDAGKKIILPLAQKERQNLTLHFTYETYEDGIYDDSEASESLVGRTLFEDPPGVSGNYDYQDKEGGPLIAQESIYLRFDAVHKYFVESRFERVLEELKSWAKLLLDPLSANVQEPPIFYKYSAARFSDMVDIIWVPKKSQGSAMTEGRAYPSESIVRNANSAATANSACGPAENDAVSLFQHQKSQVMVSLIPFELDNVWRLEYKDGVYRIVTDSLQREGPCWRFVLGRSLPTRSEERLGARGEAAEHEQLKQVLTNLWRSWDKSAPGTVLQLLGVDVRLDAGMFTYCGKQQYSLVQGQGLAAEQFVRDLMSDVTKLQNPQLQVPDGELERWRGYYANPGLCFLSQLSERFCSRRGQFHFKTFHHFNSALFGLIITVYNKILRRHDSTSGRVHGSSGDLVQRGWSFPSEAVLRRNYRETGAEREHNCFGPNSYWGCVLQLLDYVRHKYTSTAEDLAFHLVPLIHKELSRVLITNIPHGWTDDEVRKNAAILMAVDYTKRLIAFVQQDICHLVADVAESGKKIQDFQITL